MPRFCFTKLLHIPFIIIFLYMYSFHVYNMNVMISLLHILVALRSISTPARAQQQQQQTSSSSDQCFGFTNNGKNSVARDTFEYWSNSNATLALATQGSVIELSCASAICPMPQTRDCYFDSSVCTENEWCLVETEVMWGPWAQNSNNGGETPGANGRAGLQCSQAAGYGMEWWFDTVCSRNTSWGPWESMRGRCVQYRKQGESCQEALELVSDNPSSTGINFMGPLYPVRKDSGKPFSRAMLCHPSLICTGDVEPTPHTCVKRRPANVCYVGPWWDSQSWCKVGGASEYNYTTGLPESALVEAAQSFILQIPQEHMVATEANFWYSSEGNRSRDVAQNLVQTLWPDVYRSTTTFPIAIPDPRLTGPPYTAAWNETASEAQSIMIQTPRVWSLVHSLVSNIQSGVMTQEQVLASQGLAMFLAQSFICPDCRGFWRVDVLDVIGIPPSTTNSAEHEAWWWRAHNMVSEHTAATRGGYPWIYPRMNSDAEFQAYFGNMVNNTELLRCQNPFFLSYSDAKTMWKIVN